MNGEERRNQILHILETSKTPVSGTRLAKEFDVSRQVIVQDIALIRARDIDIGSTNRGYVVNNKEQAKRVFKVHHSEEETEKELQLMVDLGGTVCDVFVYHKTYGVIRGDLKIKSRYDIGCYLDKIRSGKSSLLMKVTSGYHYHTVTAESTEVLDRIQDALGEAGFLAKLQEYEPVDFWS